MTKPIKKTPSPEAREAARILGAAGGRKSKRKISPEAQAHMIFCKSQKSIAKKLNSTRQTIAKRKREAGE